MNLHSSTELLSIYYYIPSFVGPMVPNPIMKNINTM